MTQERKEIWLLERTRDRESHIIGFYSTKMNAVDAVRRYVAGVIDKAVHASGVSGVIGMYISEGFLLTRSHVEVDSDVTFSKFENADAFHVGEDLGDVK